MQILVHSDSLWMATHLHSQSDMHTEVELNRIAYEIRGAALAIHQALGPGCFESAYIPCLAYELGKRRLEFRIGSRSR